MHYRWLGNLFVSIYLSVRLYRELSPGVAGSGMAFIASEFRQQFRDCAGK